MILVAEPILAGRDVESGGNLTLCRSQKARINNMLAWVDIILGRITVACCKGVERAATDGVRRVAWVAAVDLPGFAMGLV